MMMARKKPSKKQTAETPPDAQRWQRVAEILTADDEELRQMVLKQILQAGQPAEHQALAALLVGRLMVGDAAVQRRAGWALAALGEVALCALLEPLQTGLILGQHAPLLEAMGLVAQGLSALAQAPVLVLLYRIFPCARERALLHGVAEAMALIYEAKDSARQATSADALPSKEAETASPGQNAPGQTSGAKPARNRLAGGEPEWN
jgi:hypothetical protein